MSFDKTKVDNSLGLKVQEYLVSKGVQTPTTPLLDSSPKSKIEDIENSFKEIMTVLGLDLTDDSLVETPKRMAKMYVNEIFWGLNPEKFPKCTAVDNKMGYDEMVTVQDINVMSSCEHHLTTIDGRCAISYIPGDKVIGLSKFNRIVEYFSKRPQIQERLTEQIFFALECILGTSDIAVHINAKHYCVAARGVEDQASSTTTTKLGGRYKIEPAMRSEFFNTLK